MSKATDMLIEALGNMRATFDSGRNFTHPCTFCGKSNQPHELVTIGRYPNGDELTRPVCPDCMAIAKAHNEAARRPSPAVEVRPTWPTVDQIGELVNAVNKESRTEWEPGDAMRLIGALAPASGDDSAWACNARRLAAERGLIDVAATKPAVEVRGVVQVITTSTGRRPFLMVELPTDCGAKDRQAAVVSVRLVPDGDKGEE